MPGLAGQMLPLDDFALCHVDLKEIVSISNGVFLDSNESNKVEAASGVVIHKDLFP